MSDSRNPRYVDHPAPDLLIMTLLMVSLVALLAVIPSALHESARQTLVILAVIGTIAVAICFYFWPLYTTYYTVSAEGVLVHYGPWRRLHPWSDFAVAYWQKGMFATRIGWPSVTPCVRLTNAVLLKRKSRGLGLYLTPNDPQAFLMKVSEFAPDLTRETIL